MHARVQKLLQRLFSTPAETPSRPFFLPHLRMHHVQRLPVFPSPAFSPLTAVLALPPPITNHLPFRSKLCSYCLLLSSKSTLAFHCPPNLHCRLAPATRQAHPRRLLHVAPRHMTPPCTPSRGNAGSLLWSVARHVQDGFCLLLAFVPHRAGGIAALPRRATRRLQRLPVCRNARQTLIAAQVLDLWCAFSEHHRSSSRDAWDARRPPVAAERRRHSQSPRQVACRPPAPRHRPPHTAHGRFWWTRSPS